MARFRGTLDKAPLVAVAAPGLAVCSVGSGARFALPPRLFVAISGVSSRVGGVIVVVAGRSTWCAREEKRVSVCSRRRAHRSRVWLAGRVVGEDG